MEWHEAETVGIGSAQHTVNPYVRSLRLLCQGHSFCLRDVDICATLYGQPDDIEALLGFDFLEGLDWQLDQQFQL